MRKIVLGLAAALALGFGFSAPASAQSTESLTVESFYYEDELPAWAAEYIDLLTYLEVLVGYPDGTFKANQNLTRAEFAVALTEGLIVLEEGIYNAMYWNNVYIYDELAAQQVELLEALARIDAIEAEKLVKNNNFIAIGLGYGVSNSETDDVTNVQLLAKVQIIELTDNLAISIRPFVTSDSTAGGTATLDLDLSDTFTLYAGGGVAANWSDGGQLTGADSDDDVVAILNAGLEVNLSQNTVTGVDVKLPTGGTEQWNPVVTGFVGLKF